jgi:DNA-binding transcriptional LysR family regulator
VDTRALAASLAVACRGSVTDAAKDLFVAQSTLSRQIAALERELECALFHRGPRGVSLTADGAALVPRAREVMEAAA